MTAQIPERLTYQGKKMAMCTEPLSGYLTISGVKPGFRANCSALWRGYIGTWEVKNGLLYLIGLEGTLHDGRRASLSTVFSRYPSRVIADWYSGTLRIPIGKELKYVHMGYSSVFERDLFLEVVKGVVVATRLQSNEVTSLSDDEEIPF